MNSNMPPKLLKDNTAEVRFIENSNNDVASNDWAKKQHDANGLDGIITTQSGTASNASGVSNSAITGPSGPILISFNHPAPEYELRIQNAGDNMELSAEIREKK